MLKKGMAREVTQELLDKIVGDYPDIVVQVGTISGDEIEGVLHQRAQRLLDVYGDSDEDEPKTTSSWKIRIDGESVMLNLLEAPGCTLRVELLPLHFGNEDERGVLHIGIRETDSTWGEVPITPGQLRTALGVTMCLERWGFISPLDSFTKQRIKEEMELPFHEVLGLWEMRWREQELYREGWNGL